MTSMRSKLSFAFITVLLAGAVGNAIHWLIPVALMGVYLILGLTLSKSQWNKMDFADSLYYMGFLFTLISLLYATVSSSLQNLNVLTLMWYMGTAVSTSIFGLTSRTMLVQFRRTVTDQEIESKQDILELAEKLREQLNRSISIYEVFSNETEVRYKESSEFLKKKLDLFSQQETEFMVENRRKAEALFDRMFTSLSDRIDKIDIPENLLSDKIDKSLCEYTATAGALSKSLGEIAIDIKSNASELNGAIKKIGTGISISATRIDKVRNSLEDLDKAYADAVQRFIDRIENFDTLRSDISRRMEPVLTQLEDVYEKLRNSIGQGSDSISHEMNELAGEIANQRVNLEKSLKPMLGAIDEIKRLKDSESDVMRFVAEIGEMARKTENINTEFNEFILQFGNLTARTVQLQSELRNEGSEILSGVREMLNDANHGTRELKNVVETLKDTVSESIDLINKKLA